VQHVIGAQTYFIARQSDDAWISRPKHFNSRSAAQADLFQAMDVIGISLDATNESGLSGGKLL
jgi:hypothetical protein